MGIGFKLPLILTLNVTLVCKSVGILDGIGKPIYGCGVKMAPDINPIYAELERSFPRDS